MHFEKQPRMAAFSDFEEFSSRCELLLNGLDATIFRRFRYREKIHENETRSMKL